jgi:hypothetical protein
MRGGSGGCGVSLVSNMLDIGIKCHFLHLSGNLLFYMGRQRWRH